MNCPRLLLYSALALPLAATAQAQISLQSSVNLALKNSPKVRAAKADLDKAMASRSETHDAYIPVVSTQAGYGQSTGAPLNVPVIFSVQAQSLVFSFSQKDYIRSANEAVKAAQLMLHSTEVDVVEDTTNTYLALDYSVERKNVLKQSQDVADQLVNVTTDRISLGVDPKVELPKSRRTATQIRLQALQMEDEIAADRQHLAQLTGLPTVSMITDRSTVPVSDRNSRRMASDDSNFADSESIRAAFANAKAKQYVAFGDSRYMLRPQISLGANYSRVAIGLSTYAQYYPRYGAAGNSENALSFGLNFNVPILDMAHRAKARSSAADAARAYADADLQRATYREGRAKLQNSARELDLRAQLARDDREIAQDQLETLELQLSQAGGSGQGPQVTPKDRLNAELQERQKYLDLLAAELQFRQTETNVMRQNDTLGNWILQPGSGSQNLAPQITTPQSGNTPGFPAAAPAGTPLAPAPAGTAPR